jgi:hypothetical protein
MIINPNTRRFLKEVTDLCKKYKISISHEDTHGCFILENYDEYLMDWFNDAKDITKLDFSS